MLGTVVASRCKDCFAFAEVALLLPVCCAARPHCISRPAACSALPLLRHAPSMPIGRARPWRWPVCARVLFGARLG